MVVLLMERVSVFLMGTSLLLFGIRLLGVSVFAWNNDVLSKWATWTAVLALVVLLLSVVMKLLWR
jgi:hypothetical protein